MKTRWRKVIRDLARDKTRTLLVVLAIAVGVISFGSVFITQDMLLTNMQDSYLKVNPSTVKLYLSDFDDPLILWADRYPGVKEADGKATRSVKLELAGGREIALDLISVPDYSRIALNLLDPRQGNFPPGPGEIMFERESYRGISRQLGDTVEIELPEGNRKTLVFSGLVYDNGAIPFQFTNRMTAFVSWETLSYLGFPKRYNMMELAVGNSVKTLSEAEKLTDNITTDLKDRGMDVYGSRITPPGEHWAENNSRAFTAILSIVGIFSLVLSGFLVVNTITALLLQQKKQIGIMKAVGGRNLQITVMYLAMVCLYGLVSLILSVPLSMALGHVFVTMVGNFLNLDINIFYLPAGVLALEVASSVLIPLVSAVIPILKQSKVPVRFALYEGSPVRKAGFFDLMMARIRGLGRPYLISIRNVFRKKGRLALTLGTLIVAGALFISVINVRSGMVEELDRILQMFDFQVNVQLDGDYDTTSIKNRLSEEAGVTAIEARTGIAARRIKDDGTKGAQFSLSGVLPDTVFSHPVMLSGRWLEPGDQYQTVLSSGYISDNPDLTVGSILKVKVGNDEYDLEVVGINVMARDQKIGFMNIDTVSHIKDQPGRAATYLLRTEPADGQTQERVANEITGRLKRAGIEVISKETKQEIFNSASGQFDFMVFFLLSMAVMVAAVGGLGLAGTMSLNVFERTREIGIMRSVGAGNSQISRMVITEGMLVGMLSFLLAVPAAIPLTYGFDYAIGNAFFDRTLVFTFVPSGILIWLAIVLVIAVAASVLPAGKAEKMSINETLAYE